MQQEDLLKKLESVSNLAAGSKLSRLLAHPKRYLHAFFFRELVYKKNRQEKEVYCNTFFDQGMRILLPCSTDIYLTGGKSDESELRLAKFMISNLKAGQKFADVGAHYGYFSLLAAELVQASGKVYSFEAAPRTFNVLQKNISKIPQATAINAAVSDKNGTMTFYEFPTLYSEYNTLDVDQFKNENWYEEQKPNKVKVKTITLDDFLNNEAKSLDLIKVDVEGAEHLVVKGLQKHLTQKAPMIVMEYLSQKRGNTSHREAEEFMKQLGYGAYVIQRDGSLMGISSVESHMTEKKLDSDNIVFQKV